ncbi:MAG TPA: haloalkane dehalogenase [bacterium]|nr:haloalkane dehalogenase [bacterium]
MAERISPGFPYESRFVQVKGSRMHYVEAGQGDPILLIHGNPTSSYLWRNVIPHLTKVGRCIAPDLIGFGKSDKPDIPYRVFEHAEYIEGFIEALKLKHIVLVLHDWGGFMGLSYAAGHPDNVRAIALMEAVIKPMRMRDRSEGFQRAFSMMRSQVGRDKVLKENFFVERVLPGSILRKLSEEEMAAYRAPFPTPESRLPTWVCPNEVPIDGHPSDVHAAVWDNADRVARAGMPILMLTFQPGAIIGPLEVEWARAKFPNLTLRDMGPGIHFVQEDQPAEIGQVIATWLRRLGPVHRPQAPPPRTHF